MPLTAAGFVDQGTLDSAIHRVEDAFSRQVVRIRHSFGEDHAGFPAIFFRVLVRDEAAETARLIELSLRLSAALMNEIKTEENGIYPYLKFRSVSEQEKLKDPNWE